MTSSFPSAAAPAKRRNRIWLSLLLLLSFQAPVAAANAQGRHDRSLSAHPCAFGQGEQIDDATCVQLEARTARELPDVAVASRPARELRQYCPTVALLRKRANGEVAKVGEITFPNASMLYDVSSCCVAFDLKADPSSRRLMVSGSGRDCFGGTASFGIEEIYRIDTAGKATLLRNNNRNYH
jgi:hypothetical protein